MATVKITDDHKKLFPEFERLTHGGHTPRSIAATLSVKLSLVNRYFRDYADDATRRRGLDNMEKEWQSKGLTRKPKKRV